MILIAILALKGPIKMHLIICCMLKLSAANNCLTLLANLSIQAKSVEPEKCGSTLFAIEAS